MGFISQPCLRASAHVSLHPPDVRYRKKNNFLSVWKEELCFSLCEVFLITSLKRETVQTFNWVTENHINSSPSKTHSSKNIHLSRDFMMGCWFLNVYLNQNTLKQQEHWLWDAARHPGKCRPKDELFEMLVEFLRWIFPLTFRWWDLKWNKNKTSYFGYRLNFTWSQTFDFVSQSRWT